MQVYERGQTASGNLPHRTWAPENRLHQAHIEHPPAKGRLAGAIYLPMSHALTGASLSASKLYLVYS